MDEKRKQGLKWLAGVGLASSPYIGGAVVGIILLKQRRARRRRAQAGSSWSDSGKEVKALTSMQKLVCMREFVDAGTVSLIFNYREVLMATTDALITRKTAVLPSSTRLELAESCTQRLALLSAASRPRTKCLTANRRFATSNVCGHRQKMIWITPLVGWGRSECGGN